MRRSAIWILAVCLMTGFASPAGAAIRIKRINFDPDGADSGTNRHLNKEWIIIKNTGDKMRKLDGWKLHDRGRDHTYVFGDRSQGDDVFTDIRLEPRGYIRLHTGKGQDSATASTHGDTPMHYDFYLDLDSYVWNNDGDRATLKNPAGEVVDRCSYTASAESPKFC